MGVLSLGVACGNVIRVIAEGEDAEEAVKALPKLIESKFGEE